MAGPSPSPGEKGEGQGATSAILVGFGVVLAGFLGMVHRVKMVAVRNMGVVSGLSLIHI